jgi:hypothetical protein
MRIAVLVYGRLNKCVEHYNNIVEALGNDNSIDFFLSSDNSSESQLDDFIRLYKPVDYTNNTVINGDTIKHIQSLYRYNKKRAETNLQNMLSHFINKYRVFSLLELYIQKENIDYDVVVSLRVDLVFKGKFKFKGIENNRIYIPRDYDHLDDGINDQVAYGRLTVMKKYNSIFLRMFDLLDRSLSITHPECLTLANIQECNLEIERVILPHNIER